MDEVFRLEGVSFSYAGRPALKGVGFAVRPGDSLAILGANGSGKSTLLKILDGLVFPEAGSVLFNGQPLTEAALHGAFQRSFRSRVGFVFAEPDSQLFCPTVREDLSFGPLQLGMKPKEAQERVSELLDMLGMTALADRAPYTLSGGEKKKAAIASVLAVNPEVLLLDEPTNGLDPRTQVWLYELLEALKAAGKTIIMATHDLSLVQDLSDRVVVLDEAHSIAADGTGAEALGDKDLRLRANIIHQHAHRHGAMIHRHSHGPYIRLALRGARVDQGDWQRRVDRYLEMVGLGVYANQYPLYLSGGQRHRIGLARAMAIESDLVLMDEPFASVDELTARQLRQTTRHLCEQLHRTVLFVTHNLPEAAYMSDFVVTLTRRPASLQEYVANPLGSPREWGSAIYSFAADLETKVTLKEEADL